MRFGLVTLAGGIFTVNLLLAAPMTASPLVRGEHRRRVPEPPRPGRLGAFHASLGGQPLWSEALFE